MKAPSAFGGVGVLPGARPAARGQPGDLVVLRRQQLGEHVAEHVVGERRVVGERGHVEAGAAHRVEGERRVAVPVGEQRVVVQVGVDERGAGRDPGGPGRTDGRDGAGVGDRRRVPRGQPRRSAGRRRPTAERVRRDSGAGGEGAVVLAHADVNGRARCRLVTRCRSSSGACPCGCPRRRRRCARSSAGSPSLSSSQVSSTRSSPSASARGSASASARRGVALRAGATGARRTRCGRPRRAGTGVSACRRAR